MFKYYNSIAEQYSEIDTRVHRKNMMKIDGRIWKCGKNRKRKKKDRNEMKL